ncbi:MAG: glycosyltransferase family 2 protein [Muribaculaceae bacterium]|nr:glycosyltransferase family 2 protein [Muribaculaceae bacterium]
MPTLSIIVPVYNTERFLSNCIESILNQTFSDFELILVNDGSKDNSLSICRKYSEIDSRLKVISQENQGVTEARKKGVQAALGEYVIFVDSDDTIPVDSLENLWAERSNQYDIVIGGIQNNLKNNEILEPTQYQIKCLLGIVSPGPVGKLFRRSLFDEKSFNLPREIIKGEDMLMNIRIAFNCRNKIKLISKNVYNYNIHDESCMAKFQTSWDYEGHFYKYYFNSVPEKLKESYLPIMTDKAMEVWLDFFGYNYSQPKDLESSILYQIIDDHIDYSTLNPIDKKLFHSFNTTMRIILINLKRSKRIFSKDDPFKRNYTIL